MDKNQALQAALSQIEKQFGKGSIFKMDGSQPEHNIDAISTGSIGLDSALGIGGIPQGRIIEIYGPESSGKTTLTLHAIAEAQKAGKDVKKLRLSLGEALDRLAEDEVIKSSMPDEMYKVFNMGHRMEIYVPQEIAEDIIAISKSFNVDAKIVGRVEAQGKKQLTIKSEFGEFIYQ